MWLKVVLIDQRPNINWPLADNFEATNVTFLPKKLASNVQSSCIDKSKWQKMYIYIYTLYVYIYTLYTYIYYLKCQSIWIMTTSSKKSFFWRKSYMHWHSVQSISNIRFILVCSSLEILEYDFTLLSSQI